MINRKRFAVILSVGFILSVPSVIYLSAWTGPTAVPPANNTAAPLTLPLAGLIIGGGSNGNWAILNIGNNGNAPSINAAGTIYSYSAICSSNWSGDCSNTTAGQTGTVISAAGVRFPDGTLQATASAGGSIGGSGTASYVPRFTAGTTLGNSSITSDGVSSTAIGNLFSTSQIFVGPSNSTVITANQMYGNNSSNFHFNYSGTGSTYLGNGTGSTIIGAGPSISGAVTVTSNASGANVGIGTPTPGAKLDVNGYIRASSGFTGDAAVNFGGTGAAAYLPNGLWANGPNEWIYGQINTNGIISDTTGRMALNPAGSSFFNGGNVGIGLSNPLSKLHVVGGGVTIGTGAVTNNTDGSLSIGNASANYSPLSSTWSTTGSTLLLTGLDYSTIAFHDSGNRVDYIRTGAGKMQLGYDGGFGEANIGLPGNGIWNSSGNVGIGNVSPGYKLDVSGDVNATGCFRVNGTCLSSGTVGGSGTAGKIPRFTAGTTLGDSSISSDGLSSTANGTLFVTGEIKSTSANALRMIQGNYGSFFRNDGATTYLLLTASGDQSGSWNGLRPFYVDNATGNVTLANTTVNGKLTIPDNAAAGTPNLQVGDDTYFADIDVANTLGLYGIADSTVGSLKLGSGGGTISGSGGNIGIGTVSPGAKLDVNGAGNFSGAVVGASFSAVNGSQNAILSPASLVIGGNSTLTANDLTIPGSTQYGVSQNAYISGGYMTLTSGGTGGNAAINGTNSSGNGGGVGGNGVNGSSNSSGGSGVFGVSTSGSGYALYGRATISGGWGIFCNATNCGGTTNWSGSSDARLKKNVVTIQNALDKVMNLRGVNFEWIDGRRAGPQVGFIAQEVEKVLPEVVNKPKDSKDFYSLDYGAVTSLEVEAIKDLKNQVDDLKAKNANLEARLSALEAKLK